MTQGHLVPLLIALSILAFDQNNKKVNARLKQQQQQQQQQTVSTVIINEEKWMQVYVIAFNIESSELCVWIFGAKLPYFN